MAQRVNIKSVEVARQYSVWQYNGDDGYPTATVRDGLVAIAPDGRHFFFLNERPYTEAEKASEAYHECPRMPGEPGPRVWHDYRSDELADIVRRAGSIDPDLWIAFEPDTRSLEQKFADYAYEEAQERAAYGGGLYL